jgi:asparagine synthase (glutamine-hydrolysing)
MTRLAIVDVAHGHQPMRDATRRWTVVLNGEIYNHRELRADLESRGTVFRTRSDTEVVVELIAARGFVDALEELEGMFAVAAVDTSPAVLWLARDRFGEKPLFLDRRGGGFAFCSELSPLLERDAAQRISVAGVASILRFGYPWPGLTAFDGITELKPGEWLRRNADGSETGGRYWTLPDRIDEEAGSVARCGTRLVDLLDRSVEQRLVADVPLGLFLSGGIDSGAIAASAARIRPDIQAVTVGFDAKGYDERPLARATAAYVGIQLVEERGYAAPFSREIFDNLIQHHGQPFADTSAVPTRAVSRAARRHFAVVLSGDGGDELLAGYLTHGRNARFGRWNLGGAGGGAARLVRSFLPHGGTFEKVDRVLNLLGSVSRGLLFHALAGTFTDEMLMDLVRGMRSERSTREWLSEAHAEARGLWNLVPDKTLALSLYHLRHSFPQDMLVKVDRMSMAESLEVRAPFLDSRCASYALSLPSHIKLRAGVGKYVMRQALRGRLPPEVLAARKRGFAMPVRQWLGEEFWRDLEQEVEQYVRAPDDVLNAAAVARRACADRARCREANDYRALHRSVLLYGYLRWRKTHLSSARQPFERRATAPLG